MGKYSWLILPSLLLAICYLAVATSSNLKDNLPIKVKWTTTLPDSKIGTKISFKDLHGSMVDEMFNHYRQLNDEEIKTSAKNGFLLQGSDRLLTDPEHARSEVLKKFIHHTIDAVSNNYPSNDCGVTAVNGSLILKYCPGLMTIITMNHIGVYSCSSIKSLTVYGPIIIKAAECSEQIVSRGDCNLARINNYLDHDCHFVTKDPVNDGYLIAFLTILALNVLFLSFLILYLVRFRELRTTFNSRASLKGLELHNYSSFDSETGTILSKTGDPQNSDQHINRRRVTWLSVLIFLYCCRPLNITAYELLDSQKVGDSTYKYTILMESSEIIRVGMKIIKLSNSDTTSRLVHMFTSYDWEVDFENKYYCLQSGCNDKLTCREDLLPFTRSDKVIGSEFPNFKNGINYYICKNMRAYCTFANGCFILAFSLHLEEHKKYEVYKISQQNRISKDVLLPPGCYLDEYKPDRSSGVDEMYYVENWNGMGWFCHPSVYTHYPLPHSLGDLKVGENNTINFITDFMNCATDSWKDVYCTKPASFLSNLNEFCVRNSREDLGLNIQRHEDSLSWPSDKLETIKISCDRDLQLIQSDHHCTDIQIEVWDTGNTQSDLLMSIFSKSDSGIGVFVLPDSVHSESHHFGCNSVWHNTFLYDIQSLNSSGLQYRYHANIKPIIDESTSGEEIKPINEDHWYNSGMGKWFSSLRDWFTGISSVTLIVIGVVAIIIIKR